ncbi:helix-turn-helix domain-containing protein [uncultured Paracoccus sp.]
MNTLRTTRRSRGLTQAEVAASARISLPTLRALERGEGGVQALVAVMVALDLHWGWAPDRVQAARALADRRRARGLSQAQLANRIGVSRPVVIALERNLGATVATLVRATDAADRAVARAARTVPVIKCEQAVAGTVDADPHL